MFFGKLNRVESPLATLHHQHRIFEMTFKKIEQFYEVELLGETWRVATGPTHIN